MKFGKLSNYALKGQDLVLDFEGIQARIEVITSSIISGIIAYPPPNDTAPIFKKVKN